MLCWFITLAERCWLPRLAILEKQINLFFVNTSNHSGTQNHLHTFPLIWNEKESNVGTEVCSVVLSLEPSQFGSQSLYLYNKLILAHIACWELNWHSLLLKQSADKAAVQHFDCCWQKRYHSSHSNVSPSFFESEKRVIWVWDSEESKTIAHDLMMSSKSDFIPIHFIVNITAVFLNWSSKFSICYYLSILSWLKKSLEEKHFLFRRFMVLASKVLMG